MTKPINERLRALCNSFAGNYDIRVLAGEAADEIERLHHLLDMRPPYYCPQCRCGRCGNTFQRLSDEPKDR